MSFERSNRLIARHGSADAVRLFAEHSVTKSCAAIVVGGLALPGVYFDVRGLKIAASVAGLVLPVLHLLMVAVLPRLIRKLARTLDEEGGRGKRL